jgi:hypothetical protein
MSESEGASVGKVTEQAQEKAQEVAGETQQKVKEATGKAQEGLRTQIDDRSTKAGEQVSGTAGDLKSVGEELRKQGKDGPAKLADRAAEQTEKVGSYLQEKNADDLLHDVEDFGRRQPLALLAGGIAVGLVAARFLKASSRSRYQSRSVPNAAQLRPQVTPPTPQPAPSVGAPAVSPPATPVASPS